MCIICEETDKEAYRSGSSCPPDRITGLIRSDGGEECKHVRKREAYMDGVAANYSRQDNRIIRGDLESHPHYLLVTGHAEKWGLSPSEIGGIRFAKRPVFDPTPEQREVLDKSLELLKKEPLKNWGELVPVDSAQSDRRLTDDELRELTQ